MNANERQDVKPTWGFVCPDCGGWVVSGEDQFADAWICPACNQCVNPIDLSTPRIPSPDEPVRPDSRWLPIASAPKDGTHILYAGITDNILSWVTCGRWTEHGWFEINLDDSDIHGHADYPILWMHKPAPPDSPQTAQPQPVEHAGRKSSVEEITDVTKVLSVAGVRSLIEQIKSQRELVRELVEALEAARNRLYAHRSPTTVELVNHIELLVAKANQYLKEGL